MENRWQETSPRQQRTSTGISLSRPTSQPTLTGNGYRAGRRRNGNASSTNCGKPETRTEIRSSCGGCYSKHSTQMPEQLQSASETENALEAAMLLNLYHTSCSSVGTPRRRGQQRRNWTGGRANNETRSAPPTRCYNSSKHVYNHNKVTLETPSGC